MDVLTAINIKRPSLKIHIQKIWIAIVLFWAFPFIFYLAHLSSLTNYLFPLFAFVLGIVLYRGYPGLYVGHMWWLWFITPEIRRLVDYQIGFQPISPVMLTPYLVTGLTFFSILLYFPTLLNKRVFPITLAMAGIIYGYFVGIINAGLLPATFGLLNWLLPVFFGIYVIIFAKKYESFKRSTYRTFVWGTMIMGLYGLFQYINPPPWDKYWMLASKMLSIGLPLPYHVRVFSTMNSPGPFAMELMGTLLMLSVGASFWRIPAAIFGYISFLLTLVRTAWGGWAVGLIYLIYRFKPQHTIRYIFAGILILLMALPILSVGPLAKNIDKRVQSIQNVQQNASYKARVSFYEDFLTKSLEDPIGSGIGNVGVAARLSSSGHVVDFDSGIMEIPYVLGWPGAVLFVFGTIWTLMNVVLNKLANKDSFIAVYGAIALSVFVGIPFFNSLIGTSGMLFWGFCGMAIAGMNNQLTLK
ncbi:O-antigen ligase family protein [Acidithiobacillus thiooxidans]|uniref:O-antigen ligase-related domain-containing protein n=1 Tax=Acidithiobacillus thiooxidans ATCC 19377 TaxID=637390 RepID=A0A543Q4F3_ACITH|nr:O-antigen ligase family protein [Acidithiobacillus thiooxidans]MDX5934677.1 O-antigen ligase family protein [Acidithiobacillus thiooxidans]TQN51200.1 hypothetical protein DLNHIDIE_01068 [Acidithiobacillus thiooxidans ATCC 19377]